MAKKIKQVALINPQSILSSNNLRNYHKVVKNKHHEQIILFMMEGEKRFTEIGYIAKTSDKYTTIHLNRLIEIGLVDKIEIKEEIDTIFYYFLTDDGKEIGKIVVAKQVNIDNQQLLLLRIAATII